MTDIGVGQMYQEVRGISWYIKVACVNKEFTLSSAVIKSDIPHPQQEPYIGYDAPEKLLDHATALANAYLDHYVAKPADMKFTEEDAKRHAKATECYICKQRYPPLKHHVHNFYESLHPEECDDCHNNMVIRNRTAFSEHPLIHHVHDRNVTPLKCEMCHNNNAVKVRDHCHDFGHFRGTAHRYCNLKYGIRKRDWVMPFLCIT